MRAAPAPAVVAWALIELTCGGSASADEGADLFAREATPFLFLRQSEVDRSRVVLAVWEDGMALQRRSRSLAGDGYWMGRLSEGSLDTLRTLLESAEAEAPLEDGAIEICVDCPNEIHRTVSVRWPDRRWLRTWRVESRAHPLEEKLWADLLDLELADRRKVKIPDADAPTDWYWR